MVHPKRRISRHTAGKLLLALLMLGFGYGNAIAAESASMQMPSTASANGIRRDPPEKLVGERLFKETRFAQFFAAHMRDNDVNLPAPGDPSLQALEVPRAPGGAVPNPYRGKAMNCRTCHLVEELRNTVTPEGSRSYADFQPRSRVPVREDGVQRTERNSSNMVDSLIAPPGMLFLHRDGEFTNPASLVVSTLTGRNLGWLPGEQAMAVAHIARVVREDDGKSPLAKRYGGVSYRELLLGEVPESAAAYRLPPEYRLDVARAGDQQVVDGVAHIIAGYMEALTFSRDEHGVYNGSPYDLFLAKNGLPARPDPGESALDYSQRLLRQLEALSEPKWVTPKDGAFKYFIHQPFVFGRSELEGLKIFLRLAPPATTAMRPPISPAALLGFILLPSFGLVWAGCSKAGQRRPAMLAMLLLGAPAVVLFFLFAGAPTRLIATESGGGPPRSTHAGNCAACHTPPQFTDFKFHNTGSSQDAYDMVHGAGAFARLPVPGYDERRRAPEASLPATPQHPRASGIFRSAPVASDPRRADLGMWNVYANDDFPEPQAAMRSLLCPSDTPAGTSCDPEQLLPLTLGRFKTPTVRDLGQSDPYLHSGEMKTIEDVLVFYQRVSALAREGKLRNGDPAIAGITLDELDVVYLSAFLRSLNEDYE